MIKVEFDFSKGRIPTNSPNKPGRGRWGITLIGVLPYHQVQTSYTTTIYIHDMPMYPIEMASGWGNGTGRLLEGVNVLC